MVIDADGPAKDFPLDGLDSLLDSVIRGFSPQDLEEIADAVKGLPTLGMYNAILVNRQRPGARFVATASQWASVYGRKVQLGARPLVILFPFAPVNFVYDIADTEGPELAPSVTRPFHLEGPVTSSAVRKMRAIMSRHNIACTESADGSQRAGAVRLSYVEKKPGSRSKPQGHYEMTVASHLSPTAQVVTIFHELAHIECGHVDSLHKRRDQRSPEELSSEVKEFEAEIVAWLLAARQHIDTDPRSYLKGQLAQRGKMPLISLDEVVSAAGKIERMFGGALELHNILSLPEQEQLEASEQPDEAREATEQEAVVDPSKATKKPFVSQGEFDLESLFERRGVTPEG